MHTFLAAALLSLCLALPAHAAESAATTSKENPQTSPQSGKMSVCAQEYHQRNIPKPEYRKFMSVCLKKDYAPGSYAAEAAKPAEPALSAKEKQQNKMKTCNKDAAAKGLQDQARKDYMKTCLAAE